MRRRPWPSCRIRRSPTAPLLIAFALACSAGAASAATSAPSGSWFGAMEQMVAAGAMAIDGMHGGGVGLAQSVPTETVTQRSTTSKTALSRLLLFDAAHSTGSIGFIFNRRRNSQLPHFRSGLCCHGVSIHPRRRFDAMRRPNVMHFTSNNESGRVAQPDERFPSGWRGSHPSGMTRAREGRRRPCPRRRFRASPIAPS